MNNKYGYRLVDILKRGRGRKSPAFPLLAEGSERERDQSGSEMKAGGDPSSRYISVLQLLEIARPRITRAAYR